LENDKDSKNLFDEIRKSCTSCSNSLKKIGVVLDLPLPVRFLSGLELAMLAYDFAFEREDFCLLLFSFPSLG